MKLPKAVREQFRVYGRAGGRARPKRMSPEARASVARRAAIRRWTRARFGAASFAEQGLPGGELVDAGLEDLGAGVESVGSLLVSLAAPRLQREGVPVPRAVMQDADVRLYRRLEREHGELAHARYLAHLQQVESFANACASVRVG